MRRNNILPLLAFLLPVAVTSCTASLDLERFKKEAPVATGTTPGLQFYDFKITMNSMNSHINEYMEFRIVDKDNTVRAKGVYDGITQTDFSLYFKRWIPTDPTGAPYRVDWWADHNLTHKYDGIKGDVATKDHAWRRVLGDPLPPDIVLRGDRLEFVFLHNQVFVDIATDLNGALLTGDTTKGDGIPGDASSNLPINLTVVGAFTTNLIGRKIEIRVFEKISNRLIAMHRRGRVADPYTAQVFGLLDEGTEYTIQAFADLDEDGLWSLIEPAWSTTFTSTKTGINETLDISQLPIVPIETGDITPAPKPQ